MNFTKERINYCKEFLIRCGYTFPHSDSDPSVYWMRFGEGSYWPLCEMSHEEEALTIWRQYIDEGGAPIFLDTPPISKGAQA